MMFEDVKIIEGSVKSSAGSDISSEVKFQKLPIT